MAEHLLLKWGTLKGWNVECEASTAALKRYFDDSVSASAMTQHDTPEQKQALCDLISSAVKPRPSGRGYKASFLCCG